MLALSPALLPSPLGVPSTTFTTQFQLLTLGKGTLHNETPTRWLPTPPLPRDSHRYTSTNHKPVPRVSVGFSPPHHFLPSTHPLGSLCPSHSSQESPTSIAGYKSTFLQSLAHIPSSPPHPGPPRRSPGWSQSKLLFSFPLPCPRLLSHCERPYSSTLASGCLSLP